MSEKLQIEVHKLRGIEQLNIEMNLNPGIYAITGRNGSGKSSLMAIIASLFYKPTLNNYFFNSTEEETFIKYRIGEDEIIAKPSKGKQWDFQFSNNRFYINGFYEGSIIHGNRFRDANFKALFQAAKVKTEELINAEDFVTQNLGRILHGNKDYYKELYRLKTQDALKTFRFSGSPYFLRLTNGKIVSQFSLSTGENLLISVLHSIQHQVRKTKKEEEKYIVLLDEIELALHPSALVRLIEFLQQLAKERNIAIYFSTHSIELLRQISPKNVFYLHRHTDSTVEIINPCYPAYATRSIYMHDGYDTLILVEDELSKRIVEWTIRKKKLLTSKLMHIVPSGGWENVITLHQDVVSANILGYGRKAFSILDGDIENDFDKKYRQKGLHGNLNIYFLPIRSAEKYLREKLVDQVDHKFFREFGDSFFRIKSLEAILLEYVNNGFKDRDVKGKSLLKALKLELEKAGVHEKDFYSYLTEYICEKEDIDKLAARVQEVIS